MEYNISYATTTMNATAAFPLTMIIFIIIFAALCIGLILVISSIERYIWFWKKVEWVLRSIKYTIFGAGILSVIYGSYLVCDMLLHAGSGANPIHVALGIGAYIGCTIIGWISHKAYTKAKNMHVQYLASITPTT